MKKITIGMKYLDLKNALELSKISEVQEQITSRCKLIEQMVGKLYPSILWDEVCKLNGYASILRRKIQQKNEVTNQSKDD